MQERDLIEQLFEKRDMDEYFDFNNEELKGISKIMEATENKISNLLKRVHPKTRRKIGYQFDKYQQKSFRYYEKERGLVYESGFIDGINLMLLVMGKSNLILCSILNIWSIKKQIKKCNITTLMIHF